MFLGLDVGTSYVKALLVDAHGEIAARGSAAVPVHHHGDAVEQDINEIWNAAVEAIRAAGESGDLSRATAVGVAAQGGAMQVLDHDDHPLGPVISWMDGRGAPFDRRMTRDYGAGWFDEHTGHGRSGMTIGQVLRLREEDPALLQPRNRIGYVGDMVAGRLCGRRAHHATSLGISLLYNPRLDLADPDLLKILHLREEQLPDLLPLREPAGEVLPRIAEAAGLPAGIPVSAAVHDQYAAAFGAGVTHAGDVMFGAGTAWVLLTLLDALRDPIVPGAFVCSSFLSGMYGQMLSMVNGGSVFDWTVRTLGLEASSRDALDDLMLSVPPGSDGVRMRPHLAAPGAGLRGNVRGRISGLTLAHRPGHVLRASVEGLACEFVRYLNIFRHERIALHRLVMCGGAAASRVTPQIIADAAAHPVTTVREADTGALGAAMIARCLVEPNANPTHIAAAMAPPTHIVQPDNHAAQYTHLLEEYLDALETTR